MGQLCCPCPLLLKIPTGMALLRLWFLLGIGTPSSSNGFSGFSSGVKVFKAAPPSLPDPDVSGGVGNFGKSPVGGSGGGGSWDLEGMNEF
jgi:hypothetical protein